LDDWTVRAACIERPDDVPSGIWQGLVINQATGDCIRDFSGIVEGSSTIEAASIAVDLLEQTARHLEDVRARFHDNLSFLNNMQLLASKMRIQCLHFLIDGETQQREVGIIRA
jgi:hypothetical protein